MTVRQRANEKTALYLIVAPLAAGPVLGAGPVGGAWSLWAGLVFFYLNQGTCPSLEQAIHHSV